MAQRGRPRTRTPEEAVIAAKKRGEELNTVDGPGGEEFVQRPVNLDLNKRSQPQPLAQGKRVMVYHKRNTTMHLTDCKLGPMETAEILESDAQMPHVAQHILRVA